MQKELPRYKRSGIPEIDVWMLENEMIDACTNMVSEMARSIRDEFAVDRKKLSGDGASKEIDEDVDDL